MGKEIRKNNIASIENRILRKELQKSEKHRIDVYVGIRQNIL